jgi:hypothetical protein
MKVKMFSKYKLIDINDFYRQVYKHLLKTNQAFCITEAGVISREDCQNNNLKV